MTKRSSPASRHIHHGNNRAVTVNAPIPAERPAEAGAAAKSTMDSYNQNLQKGADEARAIMAKLMADIQGMATTVMSPVISPRLDMSAISGVHADIGVGVR